MTTRPKLVRVSTVPLSLKMFCRDLLVELKTDYDLLAISSPGEEFKDIKDTGVRTIEIPMVRNISPLSDLKSLFCLIRIFRKERPAIVHSITPKAGLLSMIAAWIARVPIRLHSFTGLLFPTSVGLKRLILKTTDRITCACATHIHPEGEGVKNDLIAGGITKKQMKVLGYGNIRGVDLEYFNITDEITNRAERIRTKYNIPPTDFVFLFVGRIINDKGISELIVAFNQVVSLYPNTHLLLVGNEEPKEDPLTDSTLHLIADTPNIHRTNGWVDDVRTYMAASDVLVFPSYREGFPNVVLEAGAMGLPTIATDINGSREIISNGFNGDIIPPHDAESLFKIMIKYVQERHYVSSMAQNCRKLIAERYDARFVRACLKNYYKELLEDPQC